MCQVPKRLVAANPQFIGMSALQVMEEVIKALETAGVAVWLDNHMLLGSSWPMKKDMKHMVYFYLFTPLRGRVRPHQGHKVS